MITAVDTNVLIDVFLADPQHGEASAASLSKCLNEGSIIACAPVWAEVNSAFATGKALPALEQLGVSYRPLHAESAMLAGKLWRLYRSRGGSRERVVADFLIGAHGVLQADRLLTRDRGFYRDYFADLTVLTPE